MILYSSASPRRIIIFTTHQRKFMAIIKKLFMHLFFFVYRYWVPFTNTNTCVYA